MDSNPICNSPAAVAYSSCSDSPMMDIPELQANANMVVNQMLLNKRSSDFARQWAIQDFKALLKQQEAKETAANKRARIVHSRSDLSTKVKCAKAVMKAKYEYRVVVQEARAPNAASLKSQRPPIWRPSAKMQLQNHLNVLADTVTMQSSCTS